MGMTNTQVRNYLKEVLKVLHDRFGITEFEPSIRMEPSECVDCRMSFEGSTMFQQLELDFASALASALDEPEQADIPWMCESLEQYLQGRTHQEQLRVAGDAIRDIADVVCQRAELLIQDWEDRHNTQGPVMDEDFLAGMVQETMHLDISDLCRQPKSRKRDARGSQGCPWSPSWARSVRMLFWSL